MSFKVYITDYDYSSIGEVKEVLSEIDCEIIELQTKDEEILSKSITGADALLVQYAKITPKVFDSMPKCRVISRFGIGVDMIDI